MNREEWLKLRRGSIIKSKAGVIRKVRERSRNGSSAIELRMLRSGNWKRSREYKNRMTVYLISDRSVFTVVKY